MAIIGGSASIITLLAVSTAFVPGGVFNSHLKGVHANAVPHAILRGALAESGGESTGNIADGPSAEQYDNRAYPNDSIAIDQSLGAASAFQAVSKHSGVPHSAYWRLVGPSTGTVPGPVTYTGRGTVNAGRTTAIAVSPTCGAGDCRVWIGTAGGGVWATNNGLAQQPEWHSASDGLLSNAIGSLILDPTDATGNTLYAGTGEPNGSGDSEAGLGLYKSTNAGKSWTLVTGSLAVASNRSIGAVAVDPANANHLFIGTDVARHGSSSVNGGRFTPPNAPKVGLYESNDGGATFTLAYSKQSDTVVPSSANGGDFFRGGVTNIKFDPTTAGRVYFSIFDYGLYRSASAGGYEQVFASAGGGSIANSAGSRTEFALAPLSASKLRIYVGDTDGNSAANLYRVDNANVPAATLTDGTTNPGWTDLSNPTKGTPGFGSYNFCGGQCSYDMPVASPAGQPDTVWIGGQMQYSEIFTAHQPSNGRAVQRSVNAGASFTDMTNDTQSPPLGMHPDQHGIAFVPSNPNIAFVVSDGGIVRTSGAFADASADCSNRGISGADLVDCQGWLKAIPTQIFSMNAGLSTLQFQSVTVNPQNPTNDIIGGTQDNGTWAYSGPASKWFESVGGDGGQSVIDASNANIRMHTYTSAQIDTNFKGTDPLGWNWVADPLLNSGEAASFYAPLIGDPKTSGTMFVGLQHVWRTQDSGGSQAYLEQHCNEFTGDFTVSCGDWVPLGGPTLTGGAFGADKGGSYVVATARAASDSSTLWTATRRGRLFVSTNANAADASSVTFNRIDTSAQPRRFISGIAVDPNNANHAYVSFSGYDAYTPTTTGHVFEVTYNPATNTAVWNNISHDLGDVPVTGIAFDDHTGDLYISSDFGVAELAAGGTSWTAAAPGLPTVAVYGLTISSSGRVLYAATHGRSVWAIDLSKNG